MQVNEGTEIIGHRGAGGHAPENTEAAFAAGIKLGATALEVDIQFTADGLPVVYHDRTLERMAGVRGRIREQSARELAGYDIGFKFGDDYRGLRILTLDEAARLLPREIAFHVEIKDYDTVTSSHLKEVLGSLRRRNLLDRALISSFNEKILSSLRALDPRIRLGLLVSGRARGAVERAVALQCFSLHPEAIQTDRALVEEAHAQGLKVFPFTVNEPAQMKQLLALGVDGIYTDFPGRLVEIVGHRPRPVRTPAPRGGARHEASPRGESAQRRAARQVAGAEADGEPLAGESVEELEAPLSSPAAPEEEPLLDAGPAGSGDGTSATDPAEETLRRKRRRGRRGGRRHKRKTSAPGSQEPSSLPEPSDFAAPLPEASAEPGEAGAGEEELPSEPSELAPTEDALAPDAARKRRRRGRRGGRRHRRGAGTKEPADGGVPSGGQV
jgi:glycerophosphoryl diester phosphodiesterase